MSATKYTCDQAIFTSIRTPMGEGYRIIAASLGVRSDEKQTITRYSPSHEGLCSGQMDTTGPLGGVQGAAFYPLPSGRFCVALSCPAGAEHTGRGGQRVYTHNIVIRADDWPLLGYNPFNALRAMAAAGLTTPQLKPPAVLPGLELSLETSTDGARHARLHPTLGSACRGYILRRLLEQRRLIVSIDNGWLETAEALILGIPGPLRPEVSFGAGLRFSHSRSHHLDLLADDKGLAKARSTGQPVEYIEPQSVTQVETSSCPWLTFVERHWSTGDLATLAQRTSRAFRDVGFGGRDRVAQLYNCIDEIPKKQTGELLSVASVYLSQGVRNPEVELVAELLDKVQGTLQNRFAEGNWTEVQPEWPTLVALSKTSGEAAAFARPVIERALRTAMAAHPLRAAEAALDLAGTRQPGPSKIDWSDLIEEVLKRLADWADHAPSVDLEKLPELCKRWSAVAPHFPVLERLRLRYEAPAPSQGAGTGTST